MASPARRWIPVIVWVAVIYTTIPFVRLIREWYVARWDPVWVAWLVAGILVVASTVIVIPLLRRSDRPSIGKIPWVAGVTAVLVLWTFSLRSSPEESVHFLEYGVLAILLHRALVPAMPNVLVFATAALLGTLIGTVDEIIQWFSPERYWDWRDLVLNGGAGALLQLLLWRFSAAASRPPDPVSLRVVLRLIATLLLLLTLCLANTPAQVARYAPYLPGSDHLTSSRNPMAEYGHRHTEPGLGVFTSRLTLPELRREDETRWKEVAGLIDAYRRRYGEFLDTWPVSEDPFTYEARVHLFARDRNFAKARELDFTGAVAQAHLTVAWCENRIMEEYFGATFEHSSYPWAPPQLKRVESIRVSNAGFHSAVGSNLITFASEKTLRTILLALVAVMIMADLLIGRSLRRHP